MNGRYMLIFVDCNDIHVSRFDALERAQESMRDQMVRIAEVPMEFFDGSPRKYSYEDEYGYEEYCAWAHNVGACGFDYDWRIVDLRMDGD